MCGSEVRRRYGRDAWDAVLLGGDGEVARLVRGRLQVWRLRAAIAAALEKKLIEPEPSP